MDEFAFRPTHVAPPGGMASWAAPDPERPSARIDPLLPVRLIAGHGDWAQILCSNGWTAWVDGRLLVALPQPPPAAGGPPARTADPRPALAEAEAALARHRALLEDLAAGTLDLETFRERTRGQRIGLVADGETLWVFDQVHDRWCYCDGLQFQTYAATDRPTPAPVSTPVSPVSPAPTAPPGAPGAATAAPTTPAQAPATTSPNPAPADAPTAAPPVPGPYAPTRTGEP
ncbi:hypothetical protein ABZX88_04425 [Kitasatospora aureofaciens]|uniref:hypothetical protein n=1 Tax=Kitasatospora aureofaciens TaxID=1894 RepID=UPI000527940C|nr:hypothetical protein [Kitasatospora aureofaciens]HJD82764.1 hypothetical protein [Kitasatospora aureofaciens]